jgi:thiol-disulfide isomerase/thioredoxin
MPAIPTAAPPTVEPPAPSPSPSPSPEPTAGPSTPPGSSAFGIGEPAPPLRLPRVGGETVDLADFRGRPVWVNFMATWCPPCVDELPRMAGFLARHEDSGLVILAVDVGEDEATARAFFEDLEVDVPVALDRTGDAQDVWGAYALPVHFWVDGAGVVRYGALGGIGPDIMAEGLATIVDGPVTP